MHDLPVSTSRNTIGAAVADVTQKAAGTRPRLASLTAMRAFAAAAVFGYHMQLFGVAMMGSAVWFGYTGVSFFFVLSGFVLTYGAAPDRDRRRFYFRRFARIYPSYALMLLVTFLAPFPERAPRSVPGLAATLALVQGWFPHNSAIVYAINPPSWSLSCEAFFYAALPWVLPLLRRARRGTRAAIALGWFGATAVAVILGAVDPSWALVAFVNPLVRSGEFLAGAVLALAVNEGWRPPWSLGLFILAAAATAAALAPQTAPLPDVILDPAWLALIAMATRWELEGRRSMLAWRPLVYAGEISFCFYLVHQFILLNLAALLGDGALTAGVAFVVAGLGAAVIHHGVELPCQGFLVSRAKVARRGPERATVPP